MKKATVLIVFCFVLIMTSVGNALTAEEMMNEAERFIKIQIETYDLGMLVDADVIQEIHGALLMYEGAYNIMMGDKSINERLYSSDDKVMFNDTTKRKEGIRSKKILVAYEEYIKWLVGEISDKEYIENVIPVMRGLIE